MRYFRISWIDATGTGHLSDPISKWTDAEIFRRAVSGVMLTY